MTTGYALAVAIFGGFAPFISIWLIQVTDRRCRRPILSDRAAVDFACRDLEPEGNRWDKTELSNERASPC